MSAELQIPKPNGKTHPVAEMFPMLPDDELDELAADIGTNGLNNPIVLDPQGTLLDGRNRLEACKRAGVKPAYTALNGQDPAAFILSQNINRRHLSQGQRAILVAKCLDSKHSNNAVAREVGLSKAHISQAATILAHAPELADTIVFGNGRFEPAYKEAKQRKETKAQNEADKKRLQTEGPELWSKVRNKKLTLDEAFNQIDEQEDNSNKAMMRRLEKDAPDLAELVKNREQLIGVAIRELDEREENQRRRYRSVAGKIEAFLVFTGAITPTPIDAAVADIRQYIVPEFFSDYLKTVTKEQVVKASKIFSEIARGWPHE